MPVRKAITEKDGVYFVTFTCTHWLPLFKIDFQLSGKICIFVKPVHAKPISACNYHKF